MSATTVSQFAVELKMPVDSLLEQLGRAGVGKTGGSDTLTDQDKNGLLDYLRRSHGEDQPKTKITLMRKQTSEIKATDSHGRARTVQVEVRKKRVLMKRDQPEHAAEGEHLPEDEHEVDLDVLEQVLDAKADHELLPETAAEPEPVVEVVPEPEPVVEVLPEPEPVVEVVPEPVLESAPAVEAAPQSAVVDTPPVRKVLDRASFIGEKELKVREEEALRRGRLREIQERELKEKQARELQLAQMRVQAEQAAAAAKAAEEAKQQVAAQAKAGEGEKGTLHKKPDAPKKGDKGGRSADDGKKKAGIKTRGSDGGSSWKDGRHGHKKSHKGDDGQGSFQAPTEPVTREVHVPETISVSDLAHKMAVKAIEVIKKDATNTARLFAMLQIKIFIAPFFEAWIQLFTKWIQGIFSGLMKVFAVFINTVIRGEIKAATKPPNGFFIRSLRNKAAHIHMSGWGFRVIWVKYQ